MKKHMKNTKYGTLLDNNKTNSENGVGDVFSGVFFSSTDNAITLTKTC